jgi:aminomethyltransferase
MGVSEMTRFGMKEADFNNLGRLMADIIIQNQNKADEVAEYRKQFHRMHYCLSPEKTLDITPRILESLFPNSDYFNSFSQALKGI